MKRLLLILPLAACSPPALCDREAQHWNKFETQEDQCHETQPVQIISRGTDNDRNLSIRDRDPSYDLSVPDHPRNKRDRVHKDRHSDKLGNPGNDKPVGRAGEKPEKGMDERSPEGNRGRSN